jgi:hypothetical protein
MDSKTVSAAIRKHLRPLMRAVGGFTKFTGRSAWRVDDQTTSVIQFQSFSAYLAEGIGCTTFSFAVRLGLLYRYGQPVTPLPNDAQCTFRMTLGKSTRQPVFVPYASVERRKPTDRPDVFFVQRDGANLDAMVADVAEGLRHRGFPALEQLRDPPHAYQLLLDGDHVPLHYAGLEITPPGAFDSPARREATLRVGHVLGIADPRVDIRAARERRASI